MGLSVRNISRDILQGVSRSAFIADAASGGSGGVGASALNHFDDNLTTDAVAGNTWTPAGTASHYTSDSKFGAGCLQITGTGSGNRIAVAHASVNMVPAADDDFTWAAWVYIVGDSWHDCYPFVFGTTGSLGSQTRILGAGSPSLTFATQGLGTVAVPLDEWAHIAITRASGTVRGFINGAVGSSPLANTTDFTSSGSFNAVGARMANTDTTVRMDEFLFIHGSALYTESFTPPAAPYS